MKTLDEVIKAVHHCGLLSGFDDTYEYDGGCPYKDCSKCEQKRMLGKDIIQYLKAYKDDKNDLTALRAYWAEQQANPPLTWDELKSMVGKPIWVEIGGKGAWDIVWKTCKIYEGEDPDTWMWFYVGHKLPKTTYDSNGWRAYRKERNVD